MANFFVRFTDIITANINEMLDRVEDPERMIRQIIYEMEENIRRARDGVLDAMTNEKQLEKELNYHRNQSAAWKKRAEKSLRAGKEEMTRSALTRKKEHDRIAENLDEAWETAHSTSMNLKTQLKKLEHKLGETKRRRASLAARQKAAEARQHMSSTVRCFSRGIHAQDRFDRMEERVIEIEARSEAVIELDDEKTELEKEFDDLETETDVELEFEALKKEMETQTAETDGA